MTAVNHALTGALIGLAVTNPAIALPAAFASHFICDALPHFGAASGDKFIATAAFRRILLVDALLCIALVGLLAFTHVHHWWLAAVCAFVATSPDLYWFPRFVRARRGKSAGHGNDWFSRFAGGIQWFQRPIGAVVEVAWFIGVGTLVLSFLLASR